ncbi:MAG: sporulation integral membrane protein YlbJ [Bacillota bacterium]|nr:sporulation integral membrane protein YlbJ [Bacillota bacterium]
MPRNWLHVTAGMVALLLVAALIVYSEEAFEAALAGMKIFWEIVFPSLLPFFVLSEIMLALGVVHFLGVIFEPLMRPLFNVPGAGAFVMSMGLAAGYPMDAVITAKFRKRGLCNQAEGERLLAFTNTADPLFIFGAVAVGMFRLPELGAVLALAHYLGAFCVGLTFRFYRRSAPSSPALGMNHVAGGPLGATANPGRHRNLLARAARALIRARREDGRPFGRILSDAVNESVKTLLMICGFIMLFSVVIRVLQALGVVTAIAVPVRALLSALHLDPSLSDGLLRGLFEIDLGAMAASSTPAPLAQRAIVASAIIAWSGLSVHAQVASVMAGSDVRMTPFVGARLLHACYSAVFTALLLGPLGMLTSHLVTPVLAAVTGATGGNPWPGLVSLRLGAAILCGVSGITALILAALLAAILLTRARITGFRL